MEKRDISFFHGVALVNSDVVNLHGRAVLPGGEPLVFGVVEGVGSLGVGVGVWLAALAIFEVSIGSTCSHVEDQVVLLVERSALLGLVLPRVVHGFGPAALGEHVLVEWEVEHGGIIDGGLDSLLGPLEAVHMEVVSQRGWMGILLGGLQVGVHWPAWSPVESRTKLVASYVAGGWVVASGLNDIDLTGSWPLAIVVLSWEHPDSWPEPVTLWQLGLNLNSAVLEVEGSHRSESGALNWVVVVATRSSVSLAAIEGVAGASVGRRTSPKVDVSSSECSFAPGINGERRLQMQNSILDEGVGSVVGVVLELPVSTSTHGDLMLPGRMVQDIELV